MPRFIKKIASGNLRGSAVTILDANILGASCSRVCPVAVLCEGACVMHRYNEQPIQIGRLQRHAMEHFYKSGATLPRRARRGANREDRLHWRRPSFGLPVPLSLRLQGFQVTVFDKMPLAGGLNTYGVAEYKLRSIDSLREIETHSFTWGCI